MLQKGIDLSRAPSASRDPFPLAITASGVHQGELLPAHVLGCDEPGGGHTAAGSMF
jgi:hypothetical protein